MINDKDKLGLLHGTVPILATVLNASKLPKTGTKHILMSAFCGKVRQWQFHARLCNLGESNFMYSGLESITPTNNPILSQFVRQRSVFPKCYFSSFSTNLWSATSHFATTRSCWRRFPMHGSLSDSLILWDPTTPSLQGCIMIFSLNRNCS